MENISRRTFLGAGAGLAATAAFGGAKGEKPLFTMGLICDTHVGGRPMDPVTKKRAVHGCERVKMALELFRKLESDYVVNVGDVCDLHFPEWYPKIRETFDAVFAGAAKRPKAWYVYAGHDVLRYKGQDRSKSMENRELALNDMHDLLGADNPQKTWVTDIKGVPVVVFREWSDKDDDYAGILKDVCAKNPGKPVLVFDHYPAFDTVVKSNYNGGYIRRRTYLENFPQVVHISAHLHNTMRDERQIWQGSFTAFNCGCLFDWSRMKIGWADEDFVPQGYEASLMEVYPSQIVFRRFDIKTQEEIRPFDPWTVPLPFDPKTAPYRTEVRAAKSRAPEFPNGAALSATVGAKAVDVSFPPASVGEERAYGYYVSFCGKDGRIGMREVLGDYWQPASARPAAVTHAIPLALFAGEKGPFRVSVSPVNAFGKCGRAIEASVDVAEKPAAGAVPGVLTHWDKKLPDYAQQDGWYVVSRGLVNNFGRIVLPAEAFAGKAGDRFRICYSFRSDCATHDILSAYLCAPAGGRHIGSRVRFDLGDKECQKGILDWMRTDAVPVPVLTFYAFARFGTPEKDFRIRFDSITVEKLPRP